MDLIRKNIGWTGIFLFITGMFFSRALLSISIPLIFLQPFFIYSFRDLYKKLIHNRLSLIMIFFYLTVVLTWFITEDKKEYFLRMRIMLPMLMLPVGLLYSDLYSRKSTIIIFLALNILTCLIGLVSFVNYIIHFQQFNLLIIQSKPIPIIPFDRIGHIYYSFILAFAIISGIILYLMKVTTGKTGKISLIVTIINFILIHIIGARTGLLAFYFSALVLLIAWGLYARKYILMAALMAFLIITCILSVRFIPSLHNRYINTISDYKRFKSGWDVNHFSISMRIEFWKKTASLIRQHPVFGVGYADVSPELEKICKKNGIIISHEYTIEPHNQFLEVFAASGIIGLLFFLYLFFYPLKRIFAFRDYLSLSLMSVMFITFMVESALEMQIGVCYFAFMWIYVNNLPVEMER